MTHIQLASRIMTRIGFVESPHKEELLQGVRMAFDVLTPYYKEQLELKDAIIEQRTTAMNTCRNDLKTLSSILARYDPDRD